MDTTSMFSYSNSLNWGVLFFCVKHNERYYYTRCLGSNPVTTPKEIIVDKAPYADAFVFVCEATTDAIARASTSWIPHLLATNVRSNIQYDWRHTNTLLKHVLFEQQITETNFPHTLKAARV